MIHSHAVTSRILLMMAVCCLLPAGTLEAQPPDDDLPPAAAPKGEEGLPEIKRPKIDEAKRPVQVEVTMPTHFARSGSPTPLTWEIKWLGKGLLSGRLEYEIEDEGRVLGRFTIEDLTISGSQKFRTMLPAVRSPFQGRVDVQMRFVTAEKTFQLEQAALFLPEAEKRIVVLGHCTRSDVELNPESSALFRALDVSRFDAGVVIPGQPDQEGPPGRRGLMVMPAPYKPVDLPIDPLGYCAMDVLAVTGAALPELNEDQLTALRQWVEAGGSMYVELGKSLKPTHLKFLNDLSQEDHPDEPFVRAETGEISGGPAGDQSQVLLRAGLGRAVVSRRGSPPAVTPGEVHEAGMLEHWRRICAFLWKVRADTQEDAAVMGRWPRVVEAEVNQVMVPSRLAVSHAQVGDWLVRELLPETVETVPLWILGAILVVYLVVIGPVDYFGLGLLRLRRFTWVLFPVLTLAFTIGTVWLSNRYMYSTTQSRTLVVTDVVGDGRIVRENRLELVFANSSRKNVAQVQRGLYTPLNLSAFGAQSATQEEEPFDQFSVRNRFNPRSGNYADMDRDENGADTARARYLGRIPGRYTVTQDVPQWTPQLNRLFTIPLGARVEFPWQSFSKAELRTATGKERLAAVVRSRFGEQAKVYVQEADGPNRKPEALPAVRPGNVPRLAGRDMTLNAPRASLDVLQELSLSGQRGMFQHFSQVSPSGSDHFEDLPMLDSTSDNVLLLVWVPQGDDYILYRRLYR